jgi:hypothetical protein
MKTTHLRRLLLLTLTLCAAPTLHARSLEIFLEGRGARMFSHDSIDQFGETGVSLPIVGLAFELIDDLFLEAAYGSETLDGQVFEAFQTHHFAHQALAGLRYQVRVLPWLRPFGRCLGGLVFHQYDLKGGIITAEERAVGFEVAPTLGVELLLPTAAVRERKGLFQKASVGLVLEMGYRYSLPMSLDGLTPSAGEDLNSSASIDLGAVDTSGLIFGFGIVGHF